MKKFLPIPEKIIVVLQIVGLVGLLLFTGSLLQSCEDKCETVSTYTYLEPVYMTTQEVRDGFGITEPTPLETAGKIYVYGDYLLINEPGKGIHVIDYSNKKNPTPVSFITIPGNFDMAVQDYVLYADSYIDLLAIDISDLPNINLIKRVEGAFPYFNYGWGVYYTAEPNLVITKWEEKEMVEIATDCQNNSMILYERGVLMSTDAVSSMKGTSSSPTGVGGSMARFAVSHDHLYAVDYSTLRVFNIAVPSDPIQGNEVEIGWDIETIFPYKEYLFVGSTSGVFIYDNANPDQPIFRSKFEHVNSCDPVVVDDQYAYVTLRSGNECSGYTNQLDVLDITNLDRPVLVKSYPMDNPHGLSIDGDLLFITEGVFGMKVFDATDRNSIGDHLLDQITGIHGYDVIAFDKIAILIGDDGLYIFNYADPSNLDACSIIPITGGV